MIQFRPQRRELLRKSRTLRPDQADLAVGISIGVNKVIERTIYIFGRMLRNNDIIAPHILIVDGKACGFDLRHNDGVSIPSLTGDVDLKDIPGTRNDGQLRPNLVVIVSRCPRPYPVLVVT